MRLFKTKNLSVYIRNSKVEIYIHGYIYSIKSVIVSLFVTKKAIDKYMAKCDFEGDNDLSLRRYLKAEISNGNMKKMDYIDVDGKPLFRS